MVYTSIDEFLRGHGLTGKRDLATLFDTLRESQDGAKELMGRELTREEADVWSMRWKTSRVQVNLHIGTVANLHSSALTAATMERERLSGHGPSGLPTSPSLSSSWPSSLIAPLQWSRPSSSTPLSASSSPWSAATTVVLSRKFSKRRRVSEGSSYSSKETSERERWTSVLGRLLEGTGTPISGWLARSRSPSALLGAGRRVSTLRSRVRALRSLLLWIWERQGLRFYFTPFPLVDYLQELVEQGKSRGSIKAAKSAASFGEYVAGIEERDRVTRSVIFQSLYAEILASASPGAAPGPAPRPLITLLWALENAISDTTLPHFIQVMGWWKCLQAALRHDDHRGIRPRDLVVSAGSLRGELWRSKTTGSDKMVKSRPIIITPMAYVHDTGWLLVGWQLLLDLCASPRDFLLPTPTCGATSAALSPLTHRDATTLSSHLMSHLRRPDHKGLPLLHACTASGYLLEATQRPCFPAHGCLLPGGLRVRSRPAGWLAGARRCCLCSTSTREGQPDSVSCSGCHCMRRSTLRAGGVRGFTGSCYVVAQSWGFRGRDR